MKKFIILHLILLISAFLSSCISKHEQDEHTTHEEHDAHYEENIVMLPKDEWKEFGIKDAIAESGELKIYVTLPGQIEVNQDHLAHIVPRFPGVVKEVRKSLGDQVKKDEVLAIIEGNESLSPYELKSLTEGTVIDKHITLGEALSDENITFVIADLSTVWVTLSIYQRYLPLVEEGQQALISTGHGAPDTEGTISYVAPVVKENTRTGLARVVLSNPHGLWRPGMFITAKILVDEIDVPLLVPRSALQMIENQTHVFVLTDIGFKPHPVTLGRKNDTHVEVTSGLIPGERYVKEGGFTLKAEFSKGGFGDGHAH